MLDTGAPSDPDAIALNEESPEANPNVQVLNQFRAKLTDEEF